MDTYGLCLGRLQAGQVGGGETAHLQSTSAWWGRGKEAQGPESVLLPLQTAHYYNNL